MKENKLFYIVFKTILKPIFILYYNPTIIGKENIPKNGRILIVGNHKHLYDQCLAIISTKRMIHYMAKKEYFDSKFAWFFRITGCISVDRSKKDGEAKSKATNVLESDYALGVFPEGTRNKTDKFLLPFKYGTVTMAHKTNSVIVPFGITGDYKFRSKNLIIRFGKPYKVSNDIKYENEKLMKIVENLMKENLKYDKIDK